jgi:hypothetical protein
LKIIERKALTAWYDVSGQMTVYADGTARLKVYQKLGNPPRNKLKHNKVHANRRAALAAWYRENA